MSTAPLRAVVLVSGRGSNLQSLIDAVHDERLALDIRAVVSNVPSAAGLRRAGAAGIETLVLDHREFTARKDFDAALARLIDVHRPGLVLLAGFMRVLGPAFVRRYEGRLMNIHPSLLPAFPGLDTHRRALEAGARVHGATVHFVTARLDGGPIVVKTSVEVRPDDSPESLAARVLAEEHRIYPLAARWFTEGRLCIRDGRVFRDERPADCSPGEQRSAEARAPSGGPRASR